MDEANLAIVFGPTLMWPEMDSLDMASDMMQRNLIVQALLQNFFQISDHHASPMLEDDKTPTRHILSMTETYLHQYFSFLSMS
jgi:hypothetical protein